MIYSVIKIFILDIYFKYIYNKVHAEYIKLSGCLRQSHVVQYIQSQVNYFLKDSSK